ncbi:MAG: ferritin family protein [Caldicoprobacterales bacterium]|mgnify:CR=1 FL=1|jgi:rubrerythrin|nr:ferritin family protein [Clostridiales bacterium]
MAQINFNELEALEMAIQVEKRGEAFYTQAKSFVHDDETKAMLEELAQQEREHADAFQAIYNELYHEQQNNFDDTYLYEPEVSAYLRAMTESSIFPTDARHKEVIGNIKDITDVLRIGIQAEKDSILFYTEMTINSRYVEAKNAFRRLIKEEKKHLIDLQAKLNQLNK